MDSSGQKAAPQNDNAIYCWHSYFFGVALAIVIRPRGNEWLKDEITCWQQSGIKVVVSLLTMQESRELGLEQEAANIAGQGLQFLSFPIADREVPSSLWQTRTVVEQLTQLLAQGKHVAIHCRQGVGRSALLSATILVNSGISAEKALWQIEIARGCPVPDTAEQRQWVERFAQTEAMPAGFGHYIDGDPYATRKLF